MEINVMVPDYVMIPLSFVACVMAYSVVGAIVAGIASRLGCDGSDDTPPAEMMGAFWPATLIVLIIIVVAMVLWWTIFLPARLIYKIIAK